jgi:fibro-slime domain-containing protein
MLNTLISDFGRSQRQMLILLLIGVTPLMAQLPTAMKLQGLVRDFRYVCTWKKFSQATFLMRNNSNFHIDFESPVNYCREQTGLYQSSLSAAPDGRPIPMPPQLRTNTSLGLFVTTCASLNTPVSKTTTRYAISNFGHMFQQEYYQDIPGVNIAIPIEITLTQVSPGSNIYQYDSQKFFPINGQGYVREGLNHDDITLNTNLNNYWFTTEFRLSFYYRGGEVFQFIGDDDLWVYIDGRLTSCDLGSIHIARACVINLNNLGLLQNRSYEMVIFHAERHYSGSSFRLTTSIVPINRAPKVNNFTVLLTEESSAQFQLEGYDPDYNPNLRFMITSPPVNGQLSVPVGQWFDFNTRLTYTPRSKFSGMDSLQFILTDNQLNSTVGTAQLTVNPINNAPVTFKQRFEAIIQQNYNWLLEYSDFDTLPQDMRFYLTSTPKHGYANVNETTGQFTYAAVSVGEERLEWQAFDGQTYTSGFITIIVGYGPDGPPGVLKPAQVAGIVVGSVAFFALIGLVFAYVLYYYLAAARFERLVCIVDIYNNVICNIIN